MQKRYFGIRGFMKSGTNWVGRLLNLHPEVSSCGEFHWQDYIHQARRIENSYLLKNRNLDEWFRDSTDELIRQTLIRSNDGEAIVVGDRTPTTLLPRLLPEAKYIDLIRDGRDVLVSRLYHLYNNPTVTTVFDQSPEMAGYLKQFQEDPWLFQKNPRWLFVFEPLVVDSIKNWADHLQQNQKAIQENPSLEVLPVRYEDLHEDFENQLQSMFHFLDVDPAKCAAIPDALSPGIKKESPSSFYRKGEVGDWKHYFDESLTRVFNEIAGEALRQYGYSS